MKGFLAIMVFFLAMETTFAQEVTLTVNAPESAVTGQSFRIVYTVNSTDGQFNPPKFDPAFAVSGPQQSSSRNVQWINGQMSSVSTTTLIYYVVVQTPGTYTIPPAQFETRKFTVSSEERQIVITSGGSVQSQSLGQGQTGGQGQASQASAPGSGVSLRLILSNREVYVGQPVTATLKLFTRTNLSGISDLKWPDFRGFLREDIETPPLRSLENEIIDGVQYGTGVLQRFTLYPQIPGELRIEPVEITAMVQQRTGVRDPFFDDPFFDSFFSGVSTVPQKVMTQPATVRVKPLPVPTPADFHGAVGSFDLTSSLTATEVEVNDALTLVITLKGSGNLNLAGVPVINFPHGIEKFDPKVTVKSTAPASGTKTFEYLLIPRNTGTFDIPPVSYTVFDVQQEKYVTLRTGGYSVTVTGTPGQPETATSIFVPGEEVRYIGQDIRFIRNGNGRIAVSSPPLVSAAYYWLWYALALFITAAVLLFRREQIRRNADLAGVRNRKAGRNARRMLDRAKTLLSSGKTELVNSEIARALWGYLSDKLSIPMSDLNRENCFSELERRNVDQETITELDLIVSATEYSQYAPKSEGESPTGLYRRAVAMINRLENLLD